MTHVVANYAVSSRVWLFLSLDSSPHGALGIATLGADALAIQTLAIETLAIEALAIETLAIEGLATETLGRRMGWEGGRAAN